jgi:hypothetical protein
MLLTFVLRPWPISMPPCVTSTEPSAYTLTAADTAAGEQSNLHAHSKQQQEYMIAAE